MRIRILLMSAFAALTVTGCGGIARNGAISNATSCARDINASPETSMIYSRLWLGDGNDSADKLRDPAPLTPEQKAAFTNLHNRLLQCRQAVTSANATSSTAATAYQDEYAQRNDAIYDKLVNDDLPVGLANKLFIESTGKFQADMLRANPRSLPPEQIARQQSAEAMISTTAAEMAAAQAAENKHKRGKQRQAKRTAPAPAPPNCTWVGNTLECTR